MHALEARLRAQTSGAFGSGQVVGAQPIEAGNGDSGTVAQPMTVGPTQHAGGSLDLDARTSDLDPVRRDGIGRPQTHRVAMGLADEFLDAPGLSGQHGEVSAVLRIPRDTQLPWEPSAVASRRDVPAAAGAVGTAGGTGGFDGGDCS